MITFCYFLSFINCSVKFNANECTPVLEIEYANIYGCGYLKTAAAPVKITRPSSVKYLVAKCAANRHGFKFIYNICWHF